MALTETQWQKHSCSSRNCCL